jgi:hypothetical protein
MYLAETLSAGFPVAVLLRSADLCTLSVQVLLA